MMDHLAPLLRAQYHGEALPSPRETTMPQNDETLSRVRRIETRLTQLMIGLGIGTHTQKPAFEVQTGHLVLPSLHSSIKEILDSLPEGCSVPVQLVIGGKPVGVLHVEGLTGVTK
jgi:hypothetical protein